MRTCALTFVLTAGLLAQAPFRVTVTGQGKPMILIPGLSSSGETWDTTVAYYRSRYECHVLTVAGFAGVPRVEAPILDKVRDGIAEYVRAKALGHPVIVGHSLGGFVALAVAARFPALPSKLVVLDAYPFLAGVISAGADGAKATQMADEIRRYMQAESQEDYERHIKSGASARAMVTSDKDFERIKTWELDSDRTAVTDAMAEMYAADLRDELEKIRCPTLVLATWIGFKQYIDHDRTEANLKRQYAKLAGVQIEITDSARHFIMLDEPRWLFASMDRFLSEVTARQIQ